MRVQSITVNCYRSFGEKQNMLQVNPGVTTIVGIDKLKVMVDFQILKDPEGKRVLVFSVTSRPRLYPDQRAAESSTGGMT